MAVSKKTPVLIDDHVSVEQCQKAVTALLKHARANKEKDDEASLLPGKDQQVWLVTTVKRMNPNKNLKPQRMYVLKLLLVYFIYQLEFIDPWNTH